MARPYKPLKQRPNGVWFVQLKSREGRRLTRSLETTDPLKAAARAQQAIEELRAQDQVSQSSRWRADDPAIVWDEQADGSFKERHTTASEILEPDQLRETNWFDLVREAEAKWKRKNGAGYSSSWHINIQKAIKACPYESPLKLTPKQLHVWVKQMQDQGLAPKTIQGRCALLSGLLTNSIKSGLLTGHVNPFTQIDYSTKVVKSHVTPGPANYQQLFKADLPKAAWLPLYLMAYTGLRVGEVQGISKSDVSSSSITVRDGKTESSNRTLPIPSWLINELNSWSYEWASNTYLNEKIKCAGAEITCHSMRHGWKRLSREVGLDSVLAEAWLGHSLKGLEGTYGDGFSTEALRRGAEQVWQVLDGWR